VSYDLPLRYKTSRHSNEKLRIGEAAAGLIRRGCILGLTGGTTSTEVAMAITGPLARQTLENLTLDIAFLGVNGIDPGHGASADNEGEASINALMASRARQVVVVADSTDVRAPDDVVTEFEKAGVEVRSV
jgi:DeoR family transcriptional regulator, aga operon transcriptional repressor